MSLRFISYSGGLKVHWAHAGEKFGALYGVDEIIFTDLKALLQTVTGNITIHLCEIINIWKN